MCARAHTHHTHREKKDSLWVELYKSWRKHPLAFCLSLVIEWINSNRLYVISLWAMRLDMNMKQSTCTATIYQRQYKGVNTQTGWGVWKLTVSIWCLQIFNKLVINTGCLMIVAKCTQNIFNLCFYIKTLFSCCFILVNKFYNIGSF